MRLISRRVHASPKTIENRHVRAAAEQRSAAITPRDSGGCSREPFKHPWCELRADARPRQQQRCRRAAGQAARACRLFGRHCRQLSGGAHCSACQTLRINDLRRRAEPTELRVHCWTSQASASHVDTHDLLARATRHTRAIPALLRRCADRHSLFNAGFGIPVDGLLARLTPTLTWHVARATRTALLGCEIELHKFACRQKPAINPSTPFG